MTNTPTRILTGLFLGLCAVVPVSADQTVGTPGTYTVPSAGDAAALTRLLQQLDKGLITPAEYQRQIAALGSTDKKGVSVIRTETPSTTSNGTLKKIVVTARVVPDLGTTHTVCINPNGNNPYVVHGPSSSTFSGNGPQCFADKAPGTYCVDTPGGHIKMTSHTGSDTIRNDVSEGQTCADLGAAEALSFDVVFDSPQDPPAPVPLQRVLNQLYYYDGYRAIPLEEALKNVYYDDGHDGMSLMKNMSKFFILPQLDGSIRLPPSKEDVYYQDGSTIISLVTLWPKLYTLADGRRYPVTQATGVIGSKVPVVAASSLVH